MATDTKLLSEMNFDTAQNPLVQIITSEDDSVRNKALDAVCESATREQLLQHCQALDAY